MTTIAHWTARERELRDTAKKLVVDSAEYQKLVAMRRAAKSVAERADIAARLEALEEELVGDVRRERSKVLAEIAELRALEARKACEGMPLEEIEAEQDELRAERRNNRVRLVALEAARDRELARRQIAAMSPARRAALIEASGVSSDEKLGELG